MPGSLNTVLLLLASSVFSRFHFPSRHCLGILGDFFPRFWVLGLFLIFYGIFWVREWSKNAPGGHTIHSDRISARNLNPRPILDNFLRNFMSLIFPRFSKNLHKLTPGGSGRPTTNFYGIIVSRKLSKSFIDFTRFPTLQPQMFMPTDPDF